MDLDEMSQMARELMDHHGLHEWEFKFDKAKTRFGHCKPLIKTITVSKSLVMANSPDQCVNTILHEIAHAMVPDEGHSKKWQAKAIEIGCDGKTTYSYPPVNPAIYTWSALCPQCDKEHARTYIRSKDELPLCPYCLTEKGAPFRLDWVRNPLAM